MTRSAVTATLIKRVWSDPRFAAEFRRNPKAVLEPELARLQPGFKIPANVEINVLEETETKLYFVIPPKPASPDALSDADLAQASGGTTVPLTIGLAVLSLFIKGCQAYKG